MNALLRRTLLPLTLAGAFGCSAGVDEPPPSPAGTTTSGAGGATTTTSSTGGGGGTGGVDNLCGVDCAATIDPPDCLMAVCNDGMYPGAVGDCVVVPEPAGTSCEDDAFCTVDTTCNGEGQCQGGTENDCGMDPAPCEAITCDEGSDTCGTEPADNGSFCTPNDLCQINGVCTNGICSGGTAKDCSMTGTGNDCQPAVCNPSNGLCEGMVDPSLDGQPCFEGGDPCNVQKTCDDAGNCLGGVPKDCSFLTAGCDNGVCDAVTGNCVTQSVNPGDQCFDGVPQCNVGACDANGTCVSSPVTDGTVCNDFNSCTTSDECTAGACGGTIIANCQTYFEEAFETCPAPGWTLSGEWACGVPTFGPPGAYQGTGVIATNLNAPYGNGLSYLNDYAETPPIDLSLATQPTLSYYHWYENSDFDTDDGYILQISTDGGTTYTTVTNPTPPYDNSFAFPDPNFGSTTPVGWQNVLVDLTPYVGQVVQFRFAFQAPFPFQQGGGAYVDDVRVAEAAAIPIAISTAAPPNAGATFAYSYTPPSTGGTAAATWSITGGTNIAWLSINPSTGELTGTPAVGEIGPVSITIRREEPGQNPPNFDEQTLAFDVEEVLYLEGFEPCPAGFTFGGAWACGVPTSGPGAPYSGSNVIATTLTGPYPASMSYATDTATSGIISLAGTTAPTLSFRVYNDTEGVPFDGFNLKVSANGGAFNLLTAVTPAYAGTVASEMCWAGPEGALGYQEFMADLSAFAGQDIQLRFAARSDTVVQNQGVYIDEIKITD